MLRRSGVKKVGRWTFVDGAGVMLIIVDDQIQRVKGEGMRSNRDADWGDM